jgi:hypothetical protein
MLYNERMPMVSNAPVLAQLVLLGAFSLDVELDAESLHDNGFYTAQRSLTTHLNELACSSNEATDQPWTYGELGEQAVLFAPPGFANRQMLPMAFLRFDSEEITAKVRSYLRAIIGNDWDLVACSINFFTFGFAAVRLDLHHRASKPVFQDAAAVEEFSYQLAERLTDVLKPVRLDYQSGVRAVLPQLVVPTLTSNERHEGLLWLHRILLWNADRLATMADEAEKTVPNVHEILKFRDMVIVPGVDTSVICIRTGYKESADWILRIFEFADVVYASLLQMDTWLFDQLNHVVLTSRASGHAKAIEAVRNAQFSFERVELHRAKVDTTVGMLGSASTAVWGARCRMAGLPHLDASLTRKLELLGRLAQARHEASELAHASRLNRLALVFTLFSVASSGTALINFAYGGAWLSPSESRILVLIGLFLAVLVATLLTIREVRISAAARQLPHWLGRGHIGVRAESADKPS